MRQSLLVGAIPRTAARGPKVRLQRGKWKLGCEGLIDSKLSLTISFPPHHPRSEDSYKFAATRDKEFELEGFALVHVEIEEKGTEQHISIFAEKVA